MSAAPKKASLEELTLARLTEDQLKEITGLEKKLGGDIRLIAVEKIEAMFALEAKMAPNVWIPVHQIYPEIEGLKSYYMDREAALLTKASLKNYLRTRKDIQEKKRPIRLREL